MQPNANFGPESMVLGNWTHIYHCENWNERTKSKNKPQIALAERMPEWKIVLLWWRRWRPPNSIRFSSTNGLLFTFDFRNVAQVFSRKPSSTRIQIQCRVHGVRGIKYIAYRATDECENYNYSKKRSKEEKPLNNIKITCVACSPVGIGSNISIRITK